MDLEKRTIKESNNSFAEGIRKYLLKCRKKWNSPQNCRPSRKYSYYSSKAVLQQVHFYRTSCY